MCGTECGRRASGSNQCEMPMALWAKHSACARYGPRTLQFHWLHLVPCCQATCIANWYLGESICVDYR